MIFSAFSACAFIYVLKGNLYKTFDIAEHMFYNKHGDFMNKYDAKQSIMIKRGQENDRTY